MVNRMFVAPTNGRVNAKSKTSKKQSARGAGFNKLVDIQNNDLNTMDSTQNVSNIDSLIALQDIDSAMSKQERAVQKGFHLLDDLDNLKLAILGGTKLEKELKSLQNNTEMLSTQDLPEKLKNTLQEIDLRARVELAKRGISS